MHYASSTSRVSRKRTAPRGPYRCHPTPFGHPSSGHPPPHPRARPQAAGGGRDSPALTRGPDQALTDIRAWAGPARPSPSGARRPSGRGPARARREGVFAPSWRRPTPPTRYSRVNASGVTSGMPDAVAEQFPERGSARCQGASDPTNKQFFCTSMFDRANAVHRARRRLRTCSPAPERIGEAAGQKGGRAFGSGDHRQSARRAISADERQLQTFTFTSPSVRWQPLGKNT